MGIITKPYTFPNGNIANGTQVNADLDAIIAGVGDLTTLRPTVASLGLDADLTTLALPANTTITAAGAALLDDASATAQIATLGLDADIATFALPANVTISAAGAELINDATAAAQLATLGTAAYSEGTWTPVLRSFTIVGSDPAVSGTYKRIGNLVFITCNIQAGAGGNTSVASALGTSYITGVTITPLSAVPGNVIRENTTFLGVSVIGIDKVLYTPTFSAVSYPIHITLMYNA